MLDHHYSCVFVTQVSFVTLDGLVELIDVPTTTAAVLASWSFTAAADIPVPLQEEVRLNFWLKRGSPPTNGLPAEVIIRKFAYTPSIVPLKAE